MDLVFRGSNDFVIERQLNSSTFNKSSDVAKHKLN